MPKKITIEQLAEMIQSGFEHTATKQDVQNLRNEMNERFHIVDGRFDAIESEIREIKNVLGPLVRTVAALEVDFQSLQRRVERLERKLGLGQ